MDSNKAATANENVFKYACQDELLFSCVDLKMHEEIVQCHLVIIYCLHYIAVCVPCPWKRQLIF